MKNIKNSNRYSRVRNKVGVLLSHKYNKTHSSYYNGKTYKDIKKYKNENIKA